MTVALSVLEQLKIQAQKQKKRVIFPEQGDPRVIEAIETLVSQQLCQPVLLSQPTSGSVSDCEVFDDNPQAQQWREQSIELLVESQRKKNLSSAQAEQALQSDPLLFAAVLLKAGYVDAGIAGSIATTAGVLRAGIKGVGLSLGTKLVSSTFLMEWPDKALTFGDCAVNPDPTAEQLAQIAIDSAATHHKLTGETPRVGLLSFSTKGSAEHEKVDKVRQALSIVQQQKPELAIDGELQFDAAYVEEIAAKKAPGSVVAGNCNVFIFPDLSSGNIGYKIAERLGGANAIGPVLQGMAKPWLDLSRGCKPSDIVDAAVIAAVLS